MSKQDKTMLAAVDMGTNSFHIVVAEMVHGQIRTLDRISEKVRLGMHLDEHQQLTKEGQAIALETLSRFAQRILNVPKKNRRTVGTSALRSAKNSRDFIKKAEAILGCPIDIIAGREEARLIYLGVAHTLSDNARRLVVDIGGGSTELILGKKFKPKLMESLHMGCLGYQQKYFAKGKITKKGFQQAEMAARQELLNIEAAYKKEGWDEVVGSSGTIRAIEQIVIATGLSGEGVSKKSLAALKAKTLAFKNCEDLDLPGLKADRKYILPSGLAIVSALFKEFEIEHMVYSDGALREGVLYDMQGRIDHEDVRNRTIKALQLNYGIDIEHANNVKTTAVALFKKVKQDLGLDEQGELLKWAALIHEIGLFVSHSCYHQHGAYLVLHSDLPGFSRREQESLCLLIQAHRRKLSLDLSEFQSVLDRKTIFFLSLLLRLSVVLNHSRNGLPNKILRLTISKSVMEIKFEPGWLEEHPLLSYDLEQEKEYLKAVGMDFRFGC